MLLRMWSDGYRIIQERTTSIIIQGIDYNPSHNEKNGWGNSRGDNLFSTQNQRCHQPASFINYRLSTFVWYMTRVVSKTLPVAPSGSLKICSTTMTIKIQ